MVSSYSTETAMIRTHSTLSTTAIALVHTAVGATDVSGPQSFGVPIHFQSIARRTVVFLVNGYRTTEPRWTVGSTRLCR